VILASVEPLLHEYEYGAVPSAATTIAVPVAKPHDASVALHVAVNAVGSPTMCVHDDIHPVASVTVTVYEPAVKPVILASVEPLLHKYVYGAVPPVAVTLAEPSEPPLHRTSVPEHVATGPFKLFTVLSQVAIHPFASVTVAV